MSTNTFTVMTVKPVVWNYTFFLICSLLLVLLFLLLNKT